MCQIKYKIKILWVLKSGSITIVEWKEKEEFNTQHCWLLKRPTWHQDLKCESEYEEWDLKKSSRLGNQPLCTRERGCATIQATEWIASDVNHLLDTRAVLGRVSIAATKHSDQSNLKRKGFIRLTLPQHCSSSKEVRTGTHPGQDPGGRSWCRGHGGVLLTGLVEFTRFAFL